MVHHSLVFMLSVNDSYRRLALHNLTTAEVWAASFQFSMMMIICGNQSQVCFLLLLFYLCYYHKFQMECLTLLLILHRYQFFDMSLFFLADLCVKGYQWVLFLLKLDKENIDIVSYCRHTVEDWPHSHGYNGTDLNWTNVKSKK